MTSVRSGAAAATLALAALAVLAALVVTKRETVPATIVREDMTFLAPAVQRGFNVTAYNDLGFSGPGARAAMQRLARTGTTHAALVPTWYQPTSTSSDIRPDPDKTPTDASLLAGVRAIKAAGMVPVIKPHVDVLDGTFRGEIRPDDYDTWFAAYAAMLLRYAAIAQRVGAPLFVIGDELTGVQGDRERWPPLIAAVRRVYKGKLTYAANWDPGYKSVPFWHLLDYVGIDSYHPLPTPEVTPTVRALVTAWAPVVQELRDAALQTGKPILLTEIGYPSRRGAASAPATQDTSEPVDATEQARAYEAAYRVLRDLPFIAGVYWWDWATDTRVGEADGGAGSYRPAGKPAELVVRDYSR
ncbi:MAG: hypothetical protein JWO02_2291 [Solirubrobacterales bacterium]|nr:hypothetical protein [Solirubrobacterales bacterium]